MSCAHDMGLIPDIQQALAWATTFQVLIWEPTSTLLTCVPAGFSHAPSRRTETLWDLGHWYQYKYGRFEGHDWR
eukprot:1377320-Amorphochlora_amoeboformis.AAC.1